MSQSDFSFSQFGSCLQFQVRRRPKAIPAEQQVKTINDILTNTNKSYTEHTVVTQTVVTTSRGQ